MEKETGNSIRFTVFEEIRLESWCDYDEEMERSDILKHVLFKNIAW